MGSSRVKMLSVRSDSPNFKSVTDRQHSINDTFMKGTEELHKAELEDTNRKLESNRDIANRTLQIIAEGQEQKMAALNTWKVSNEEIMQNRYGQFHDARNEGIATLKSMLSVENRRRSESECCRGRTTLWLDLRPSLETTKSKKKTPRSTR